MIKDGDRKLKYIWNSVFISEIVNQTPDHKMTLTLDKVKEKDCNIL